MSHVDEAVLARDNDLTVRVGPITGLDPADDMEKPYTGTTLDAFIVRDRESDTPLGGVTITATVAASGPIFLPSFTGAQVNDVLDDADPDDTLRDGAGFYVIVKGGSGIRRATFVRYRKAILTA